MAVNMQEQNELAYAHVISKAWMSPEFRKKLIYMPTEVLKAHGFQVPDGVTVAIVPGAAASEWNAETGYLHLPLPECPAELTGDDMFSIIPQQPVAITCCCCC